MAHVVNDKQFKAIKRPDPEVVERSKAAAKRFSMRCKDSTEKIKLSYNIIGVGEDCKTLITDNGFILKIEAAILDEKLVTTIKKNGVRLEMDVDISEKEACNVINHLIVSGVGSIEFKSINKSYKEDME